MSRHHPQQSTAKPHQNLVFEQMRQAHPVRMQIFDPEVPAPHPQWTAPILISFAVH